VEVLLVWLLLWLLWLLPLLHGLLRRTCMLLLLLRMWVLQWP
jgi:hypothetical protein